ncbi:hypothetical protein AAFC00_006490 [Neodothiora populina]|uniref:Aminoglycoside phosphotransferase domain-containing protein n=1 Tax=Neodothiora populina TaxID=2781224 RepID=A0ABR3P5J4_9PEZI
MVDKPASQACESDASSSTTPNSTSTYQYSHEPFSSFRHKIACLTQELGITLDGIERLQGGSFNRVVAAILHVSHEVTAASKDVGVILRIPRWLNEDIPSHRHVQDQAAILGLAATIGVPAPEVLAYDSTKDNAIGSPFSLQTRLGGTPLSQVYNDMSLAEKLNMSDELVRILASFETVQFANSGRLACGQRRLEQLELPLQSLSSYQYSAAAEDVDVVSFGTGEVDDRDKSQASPDVITLLTIRAIEQVDGVPEDETFSSSIKQYYDGDVDLLPPKLYAEGGGRISKEDMEIKCHFERAFVDNLYSERHGDKAMNAYFDDAYGRGRWIRRVWRFAKDGFTDTSHIDRLKKLEQDWAESKARRS